MGVIGIIVGLEFIITESPNISIPALLIGFTLLTLSINARGKSSTPFVRILMLNPRDERESKLIEWGFGLIGKLTLLIVFVLSVSTLIVSGYAWFTDDIPFADCFMPQGAVDQVCSPNAFFYYSQSSIYFLAIFGIIALFSSAIAVTRKVR
jgi:hypothetical protein